jgi:hypothetical protein
MAHLDSASRAIGDPETILSGYKPRANNFDEMMDADGRVREHWRPFLAMLADLGSAEVDRRFAAADRHLRESGVFYRVYEDPSGAVRPWPLSHIPLLIDAKEWQALRSDSFSVPSCSKRSSGTFMVWPISCAMDGCRHR